jgi:hypothetical protein
LLDIILIYKGLNYSISPTSGGATWLSQKFVWNSSQKNKNKIEELWRKIRIDGEIIALINLMLSMKLNIL